MLLIKGVDSLTLSQFIGILPCHFLQLTLELRANALSHKQQQGIMEQADGAVRPISESEDIGPFRLSSPIEVGFILRSLVQRAEFIKQIH